MMGKLLTVGSANTKLGKSDDYSSKYLSAGVSLIPHTLSGHNVCPMASLGCRTTCLNTSGLGKLSSVQLARKKKTLFLFKEPEKFMDQLYQEIHSFVRHCAFRRKKAAIRLNLISDLDWRKFRNTIFEDFPKVQWYDYTKRPKIYQDWLDSKLPPNYHLTFSRSENNEEDCKRFLQLGGNVAVVFRKELPKTFWTYRVKNGDTSDLRFLEKGPCIIGLKAKGLARHDNTNFVVDL